MIKKNFLLLIFFTYTLFNCEKKQTLDGLLLEMETQKEAMGTVSIFKNGNEVYNKSFGFKNIEKKLKANKETRYWIGSISKMYTATIIIQLIDEGKINYNTLLSVYFPNIPNAEKITIKHMLLHRSGLFNITNNPKFEIWIAEPRKRDEMIERIRAYKPQLEPGEKLSILIQITFYYLI